MEVGSPGTRWRLHGSMYMFQSTLYVHVPDYASRTTVRRAVLKFELFFDPRPIYMIQFSIMSEAQGSLSIYSR